MARAAHLVGTIPADSAAEAMDLAERLLGDTLRWLPDGETGPRHHWIKPMVDGLRAHPDLELVTDGDWSDYDKTPQFRIRKGHTLRADSLDFGYVSCFEESRPEFERVKSRLGNADLRFQVGIPSPFDMAGVVLGRKGALLQRKPFHETTVAAIAEIAAQGGDEVVFQLEVPFELIFVAQVPPPVRPLVARLMARIITAVARDAPAGTRFGIHLCLGDLEHRSLLEMTNILPVVQLGNAIAAAWPSGRRLEFVHAPFSGASQSPPTDPAFYAPLEKLRLPGGTRFVAGLAFEGTTLDEQQRVLGMIEDAYGGEVDVSAACGMGRRSLQEAVASMERARVLALS